MTNKTEWKIITILEQLRDAGLPRPQSLSWGEHDFYQIAEFRKDKRIAFLNIPMQKDPYQVFQEGKDDYYFSHLPEAIAKLKELLGEGDE